MTYPKSVPLHAIIPRTYVIASLCPLLTVSGGDSRTFHFVERQQNSYDVSPRELRVILHRRRPCSTQSAHQVPKTVPDLSFLDRGGVPPNRHFATIQRLHAVPALWSSRLTVSLQLVQFWTHRPVERCVRNIPPVNCSARYKSPTKSTIVWLGWWVGDTQLGLPKIWAAWIN